MQDSHGRTIDYIRVALTDRCNLRCWYCVGRGDHQCLPSDKVLNYDEFSRILRIAVEQLGITKIRLTGGEPLVYPHLEKMITFLRGMEQLRELTLTTNGLLLTEKAAMLHRVGLHRVNVSLEGATDEAYLQITGKACLDQVLKGLEALPKTGFDKPKLNIVLCRWFDREELHRLLEIGQRFACELRFIELMGHDHGKYPGVHDIVREYSTITRLTPLTPIGTATHRYAITGYDVVLAVIPSRTHPFCEDCRRVRLASDGQLRTCLFTREGIHLRQLLRNGYSDDQLATVIRRAILQKPRHAPGIQLQMSQVGG